MQYYDKRLGLDREKMIKSYPHLKSLILWKNELYTKLSTISTCGQTKKKKKKGCQVRMSVLLQVIKIDFEMEKNEIALDSKIC